MEIWPSLDWAGEAERLRAEWPTQVRDIESLL